MSKLWFCVSKFDDTRQSLMTHVKVWWQTSNFEDKLQDLMQGSAILSESVRNRDTGEPGISISIDFGKFPVSVLESIFTKIWYPTQWFWAFHQNLCYKTCLTLVSVSESESKFSLFLVSVSVSESTRRRTSLSIGIGIIKSWYRRLLPYRGQYLGWCLRILVSYHLTLLYVAWPQKILKKYLSPNIW